MKKFDQEHPARLQPTSPTSIKQVSVVWDAYDATKDAHGICIMTESDGRCSRPSAKKSDRKAYIQAKKKPDIWITLWIPSNFKRHHVTLIG